MKKLLLLLPVFALLFGCAEKPVDVLVSDVKTSYTKADSAVFCVKNNGDHALTVWIGLEKQLKDAWEPSVMDLQAKDAKDLKNTDRLLGPKGSFCETWMVAHTIKTQKLKVPGKYRFVFTVYKTKELVEGKPAVKVLYSEAFTIK